MNALGWKSVSLIAGEETARMIAARINFSLQSFMLQMWGDAVMRRSDSSHTRLQAPPQVL